MEIPVNANMLFFEMIIWLTGFWMCIGLNTSSVFVRALEMG
jgi:hypothetical protein